MVTIESISEWQTVWLKLLDMAYYRKYVTYEFTVDLEFDKEWKRDPDFERLTFGHVWKEYNKQRDSRGNYIEPQVVPELKKLHVPYDLFYCLGVSTFMSKCFPNCEIQYRD